MWEARQAFSVVWRCWFLMRWRWHAIWCGTQGVKHYLDLHWLQKICLPLSMSMSCCRSLKLLLKRYILWHDLTNNHDIIGPYFTSAKSVDFKFVLDCVLDTLKLFQHHGLKTSFLVCDGCSTNLITIKVAHGVSYTVNYCDLHVTVSYIFM